MNRQQYAEMLKHINQVRVERGDTSACIAEYVKRYKFVYVYNDSIFKKIFGNPENEKMSCAFLNAILKLDGPDCITKLSFVDPSVPGGPFVKTITSDLVAKDQRADRIVIEVQHQYDSTYKDRLVFYTARHTSQNRMPGDSYCLRNMNFIALQMFDSFPASSKYRHTVQLRNQDNEVFFEKETLTIIEIAKFCKGNYEFDDSRLASWLRLIENINNEKSVDAQGNPFVECLQNSAKLCNFSEDYLLTEAKDMTDVDYEKYIERKKARAEGLAEGRAEGLTEGRAEGRAEGHAEGRKEGRVEGRVEGRMEAKKDLAKNLKKMGMTDSVIAEATGLSEEEVAGL